MEELQTYLKDEIFSILIQYSFDSDIRNYIDTSVSIFKDTFSDVLQDTEKDMDEVIDDILGVPDIEPIVDLVYYEVKHYYDF